MRLLKSRLVYLIVFTLLVNILLPGIGVFANEVKDQTDGISRNTVTINGKQYDLSKLEDAKEYFQDSGQFSKLCENTSLSIIIKNVKYLRDNSGYYIAKYPGYKRHLQVLKDNEFFETILGIKSKDNNNITTTFNHNITAKTISVFDLETKLRTNANSMKSCYNSVYNLYLAAEFDPTSAAYYAYVDVGIYFAERVRPDGPWDYKCTLGWNTYYNASIDGQYYYVPGEFIGNIHYAYVGSTFFSGVILKTAGGLIQILKWTSDISFYDSYFDDPNDQIAIQGGIDYYNDDYFNYVTVTGVSLNQHSLDLTAQGSKSTLIATVNINGIVNPVNAGTTIITVKTVDGSFTNTCTVTVSEDDEDCAMEAAVEGSSSGPVLLSNLREFRDSVLADNEKGKRVIELYYRSSPYLLKEVNKSAQFRKDLYDDVAGVQGLIKLCIASIHGKQVSYTVSNKHIEKLQNLMNRALPVLPQNLQEEILLFWNSMEFDSYVGMTLQNAITKVKQPL